MTRPGLWKTARAVAAAELKSFWGGAPAGAALLVFLGLLGFFFYNSAAGYIVDSLAATARGLSLDASPALFSQGLTHIPLVLMLVTPLVTMRSLSAGRRGGHLDFFQTLPVDGLPLIAGQYLAAWLSLCLLCLLALAPFAALLPLGVGTWPILLIAALALFFLASFFAAAGLWASAAFSSPVGAGLGTLGLLGLMWVLGWAAPYSDSGWGLIWQGLAFAPRVGRAVLGQADLNDFLFFVFLTLTALFNARLMLALRRSGGTD
ncbi:MAG: hypothetical protein LBP33_10605 [Candidatus Adiutrix sp.]|jgi:ABC-2 type transport system permease protein|nr:hypothetical protein [Candidatus Adiutrix sp.]